MWFDYVVLLVGLTASLGLLVSLVRYLRGDATDDVEAGIGILLVVVSYVLSQDSVGRVVSLGSNGELVADVLGLVSLLVGLAMIVRYGDVP